MVTLGDAELGVISTAVREQLADVLHVALWHGVVQIMAAIARPCESSGLMYNMSTHAMLTNLYCPESRFDDRER